MSHYAAWRTQYQAQHPGGAIYPRMANPPSTHHTIDTASLSYKDLTQVIQDAMKRDPSLVPIVSDAINRASLKPPPPVDYESLRSAFHRELHSLDRLRSSQQYEQSYRITSALDPMIDKVLKSVNENSPRKTVESAFLC